ncbi:MAG: hypothetical protein IPM54_23140 [Polyangiaceae bacterium]|nr:hypothetical protein [Polyangiaceae bacterium]
MENDLQAAPKENAAPDASQKRGSRSPFARLAFFTIFLFTLPFTWGQTSSCNGPTGTYTGLEQATKTPSDIISLIVIFVMPVLFGFLQCHMRPTWMRLLSELIAGMFASLGAFYCFLSFIFAGGLFHKSDRIFPAPLIATIATAMMALHAFHGAIDRIADMIKARRTMSRIPNSQDKPST